jgi:hypothetical protein
MPTLCANAQHLIRRVASSDYQRLAERPSFAQLAPASQFQALVNAIESDYPRQAAPMREYNEPSQRVTLLHLRNMSEVRPLERKQPLWQADARDGS